MVAAYDAVVTWKALVDSVTEPAEPMTATFSDTSSSAGVVFDRSCRPPAALAPCAVCTLAALLIFHTTNTVWVAPLTGADDGRESSLPSNRTTGSPFRMPVL